MSYLSQLAARTLNQLPSLQPRLPARFEPARREMQADAPAPLEYATFTPSVSSIQAATVAPAQVAPAPPHVAVADSPAPPAAAPVPHPTLNAGPMHTTLVYPAEPRAEAKSEQIATPPPAALIERNTATQIIERDAQMIGTNTTIEQHVLIERDAPTVSTNTTIEQHALIEQLALIAHERILAPMPNAIPEAHMRAPRVAPQVTPYVPPAPAYAPPPEPAPVIQVSIGRIEVRAVHTPAASTPPAPAPRPGLSLDDYLRGGRS
jgi:hypothetical protein